MKNYLLTADDLRWLSFHSLEEIYNFLRTTIYNEEISIIPVERFDARAFEEASTNNFIKTFDKILKSSPKDLLPLLTTMLKRFEIENIKALLRAKMAGLDVEEAMRYVTPLKKLDTISFRDALLRSGKIEDLVKLLSNTEYGPLLALALPDYQKEGTLLPFDSSLDRYIYTTLWTEASNLSGEDKTIAEEILGIEIDMQNIKTILRCKVLKISSETIPRYIITIFYKLSPEILENGINASDVKQSLQTFLSVEPYGEEVKHALKAYEDSGSALKVYENSGSLSPIEMALDKVILRTNLNILKRRPFPFNMGVILSFLSLKWVEVRNLRIIVKGREDNLKPEKLEKMLILP